MRKGFKKCPYCGEEIRDVAKKCRFCGEFLDLEDNKEKTEIENQSNTKYGFWGRFFRKDLKLHKKWRHRLLAILFFGLLIGYPLKWTYDIMVDFSDSYRVEVVDKVENRVGDDIVQLHSILEQGEHIDKGSFDIGDLTHYRVGHEDINGLFVDDDKAYKLLYCAKNWDVDKIIFLAKFTGLGYLSMSDFRTGNPTAKQIETEIKEYRCVLEDVLDGKPFLNHQFESLDDLYVVKTTTKSKRRAFLWWFGENYLLFQGAVLISGLIIIVLYYKIIVYIIYGSYKKNN